MKKAIQPSSLQIYFYYKRRITKVLALPLCANEQVNSSALRLHVLARKASDPWYHMSPSFCNMDKLLHLEHGKGEGNSFTLRRMATLHYGKFSSTI
jgi:hypothetical protein